MIIEGRPIEAPGGAGRLVAPGAAAAEYEQLHRRALALAGIGTWQCDLTDQSLAWSDGVYDLFGLPRGSRVRREQVVAFYDPESRQEMERLRARAIACGASFAMEARIVTPAGEERWMRLVADVAREDGRPVRLFGLKQDITQEYAARDQLRRLAERDPLTGLANRLLFDARLARASAAEMPVTLLLVDLDRFKAINDGFGHLAGDVCLRATADRLRGCFPDAIVLARLGGDEFAVLLAGAGQAAAGALAEQFLHAMREGVAWRGAALSLGASVGIAASAPGLAPAMLLAEADAALYHAKRNGRGRAEAAGPERRRA